VPGGRYKQQIDIDALIFLASCAAEPIVSQTWTALVVVRDSNPRGIQVTMSQAPKATASSRRPANLGRPQSTPLPVLGTSQGRPSGASDLAPSGSQQLLSNAEYFSSTSPTDFAFVLSDALPHDPSSGTAVVPFLQRLFAAESH